MNLKKHLYYRLYLPLVERVRKFILWRYLNKRDDICWADAVLWAYYPDGREWNELWERLPDSNASCKAEVEREGGRCYCGLIAEPGYYDQETAGESPF